MLDTTPFARCALGTFATLAALLVATSAQAQVYKCKVDGKIVFADQPCAADAKPIAVRPASGHSAPSLPAVVIPGAASQAINSSSNPQAVVARAERERAIRELQFTINARRSQIGEEQAAMDREIASLRQQKTYANNNLAGATWQKSISEEMNAVVGRYDVRIRALQDEIDRLEMDLSTLRR